MSLDNCCGALPDGFVSIFSRLVKDAIGADRKPGPGNGNVGRRRDMLELLVHSGNRLRPDEGQDLAEYALLIGLIALVVIGAVTLLGENMSDVFSQLESDVGAMF
jgi:pilus assembly protein Flp/PilA